MAQVLFGAHAFDADLVVFDKDGTLIDFAGLWSHYTIKAVEALMAAISRARGEKPTVATSANLELLRADLYAMLGYAPATDRFDPHSPVVTAPLPTINTLAAGVLYRHGWGWLDAEVQVQNAFGPVMSAPLPLEMVRATAPLPPLFATLRAADVQIAVITSDDRAPTVAALAWLDVMDQIAFIACADDGYPYKPAPDALFAACEATGVSRARTVMVGDSTTDMLLGKRAGVGLCVAVLTGMMDHNTLTPVADVVLNSIGEIRVMEVT